MSEGERGRVTPGMLNICSHLFFFSPPSSSEAAARVSVCASIGGVWNECERERERKTYMTDKQRRGERSHLARRSVAAQQSNIAAKALIMSPDSAVLPPALSPPRSPILPLACELDPRGGGKHGIIALRGRPSKQATSRLLSLSLVSTRWRVY